MGSSPLTRGKQSRSYSARRDTGLIPAHAGKTVLCVTLFKGGWAHPRSRGENVVLTCTHTQRAGSSPLTRGKRCFDVYSYTTRGLIPAHAGKTVDRDTPTTGNWAHPRSRGENDARRSGGRRVGGSSPLTRGKPSVMHARRIVEGLIPAHAGKTLGRSRRSFPRRAHPRSRGENSLPRSSRSSRLGSSPLTRGKLPCHVGTAFIDGLIPAHAGKTRMRTSSISPSRAHPRSRGENYGARFSHRTMMGSSPLTRGKR